MINTFRQLIIPWLLALLLAWLMFSFWLYSESLNQQQQKVQQLAITAKYALQAYPPVPDHEQLATQLRQIHYNSDLAVEQIAVYDAQRQVIVRSSNVTEAPVIADVPKVYQISTLESGYELALMPVSAGLSGEKSALGSQLPDNGYLAIVYQPHFNGLVWFVPLVLLIIALACGMALSVSAVKRGQLRISTDLELLTRHMRRLQAAQHDCQIGEQLVFPLQSLRQIFNELADNIGQREQASEQLIHQLNVHLQQLTAQHNEYTEQRQLLTSEQLQTQRQIRYWFEQVMLLWQRRAQLPPQQLQRVLNMQLQAGQLQFCQPELTGPPFELGVWLDRHLDEFNLPVPTATVRVDWYEHPDNLAHAVKFCQQTLSSLLEAMLMLCLRVEDVSKIGMTLQIQCSDQQPQLLLTASCNGNGLPLHCQQLLQASDSHDLQWSDADIALLKAISANGGDFSSQSLDGVGCILQLSLPLRTEPLETAGRISHLLVFDADTERLQQRAAALRTMSAQLTISSSFTELAQLLQHAAFELIVLFAPQQATTAQLQQLQTIALQYPAVLCFVPQPQLPLWQDRIERVWAEQQFCLQRVLQHQENREQRRVVQHILVVDDNETNLAFVQVLLKNKPLILHTATCAEQVFTLCAGQTFDMVLLDIQLPDMSGVDVARQLRQLPHYKTVPIVAFTAHALPAEIDTYRQAGMDDIIFKPLEPGKLDTLLAKFALMPE